MQRNPVSTETNGVICDKILSIIGKPDNLVTCKAINLYGDRYRVNVYTKIDKDGCEGQRITYSCFAKINKELKVTIVDEYPKLSSGVLNA